MTGFSPRHLKYIRVCAEAWLDRQFVQQAVAHIPRGHHLALLDQRYFQAQLQFDFYLRLLQTLRVA